VLIVIITPQFVPNSAAIAVGLANLPRHRHYCGCYGCPEMKPSLTDMLCTQCGLCCDGSLFADVELASADEASALEVMGLEIEEEDDDRGLLLQPCRALKGTRCSIYPHRPDCCRTFECRLLQDAKRGTVNSAEAKQKIVTALQQIKHVKLLIGQLGPDQPQLPLKERCTEALAFSEAVANPKLNCKRVELETAMTTLERFIQKTFLE
jgi:Fe-S-cluster containining protein